MFNYTPSTRMEYVQFAVREAVARIAAYWNASRLAVLIGYLGAGLVVVTIAKIPLFSTAGAVVFLFWGLPPIWVILVGFSIYEEMADDKRRRI